MIQKGVKIEAPSGKLGVLIPGMGAVSTTFMAGVEAVKKGIAKPIGSLTQMGTIRLGKRTEKRMPLIKDFIPLAGIEDLVFGGWDIYNDNCYESAVKAGVLEKTLLDSVRPEIEKVKPMKAVFSQDYVKRLSGPNVKTGKNKMDLAEQLMDDIDKFKAEHNLTRVVMVWCGSTEIYMKAEATHATLATFEQAMRDNDPSIAPSMMYAYAALKKGIPFANGAPNLTVDVPALTQACHRQWRSDLRQGFQDRPDLDEDHPRARPEVENAGIERMVFHQHSGQPRRRSAGRSRNHSRQRKRASFPCSTRSSSRNSIRIFTGISTTRSGSITIRRAATIKKVGTTSTSSDGWVIRCRSRSTSSAATASWPRLWCWIWCCFWIWRSAAE